MRLTKWGGQTLRLKKIDYINTRINEKQLRIDRLIRSDIADKNCIETPYIFLMIFLMHTKMLKYFVEDQSTDSMR